MPLYNPPSTWQTLYFLDFTGLSTLNIKTGGDGTKTIDGKNWTATNTAAATTFSITNGTGLVINPAANSGSGNPTARTCPLICIPVTSLMPAGMNPSRHIVRTTARIVVTGATLNPQGARMTYEYATTPKNQAWSLFKGFSTLSGGGGQVEVDVQTAYNNPGVATTAYASSTSSDDVFSLTFEYPNKYELRSDTFVTALPTTIFNYRYSEVQNTSSPFILGPNDLQLLLGAQDAVVGGGACTVTYTHLRIDMTPKFSV